MVLIDEGLRGRKVVWQGSGATSERLLLLDFRALALKLDGDLVEPPEELKVHHEVVEDTEVLGLERNVDGVLCPRQQLAPGWDGMEVSDFGEIEVDGQILILILDCKVVVSAFILWTFTERYRLSADLDVRVASTSHHLDLQVIEGFVRAVCTWELDKGHRCVFLGLDQIFLFAGTAIGTFLASGLGSFSMIREAADLLVLLGAAYEPDGHLAVCADHALQRLSGEHSLDLFLAGDCRGHKVFIFVLGLVCLVLGIVLQAAETLKEFQVEVHGLRPVVDKIRGVLPPFSHVEGAEVEGRSLAATFFEDYGQVLLHAGGGDLDVADAVLSLNLNLNKSHYEVGLGGLERHLDSTLLA